MKQYLYSCLLFIGCCCSVMAQSDSLATKNYDIFVPIELTDFSQLSVELFNPLTLNQFNEAVNVQQDQDYFVENRNFESFNKIEYRMMNQYLMGNLLELDTAIAFVYRRDLMDNTDKHRYIVMNELRTKTVLKHSNIYFYIFDTETNRSYYRFSSVEALVEALKTAKKLTTKEGGITQQELNRKIARKIFKPQRDPKLGVKITLGVIAYGVFQTLIIVLSNLD